MHARSRTAQPQRTGLGVARSSTQTLPGSVRMSRVYVRVPVPLG